MTTDTKKKDWGIIYKEGTRYLWNLNLERPLILEIIQEEVKEKVYVLIATFPVPPDKSKYFKYDYDTDQVFRIDDPNQ